MHELTPSSRALVSALLCLAGALGAVMITGSESQWADAVFLAAAGCALVTGQPTVRPGWVPLVLLGVFLLGASAAFLPLEFWPRSAWRSHLTAGTLIDLGGQVSPQPWLSAFWFILLVATSVTGIFLVCAPLTSSQLAVFLRIVSVALMAYAVLCILDFHTAWKYPLRGQAAFGLLPNKNHTATLLVVGSIVSFGLMLWEVHRGSRSAAVLAALSGGPCLAALLFFSNSRAGVVFLLIGLLIWALGVGRDKSRKTVLAAVGVLVLFTIGLFLAGGSEVRNRLQRLLLSALPVEMQSSGQVAAADLDFRQPVYRDTLRLVLGQPWTGVGLGQFQYVFPHYRTETVRAARILHPESDWLMVAAEAGIPGVVALLGLAVWYSAQSWRGRQGRGGMLRWTAASAVLATMLHGAVDVPWHRSAVGWFLLVLALASLPSSGLPLHRFRLARVSFSLCGVLLVAGASAFSLDRSGILILPSPYRWSAYNASLTELGREMRYDEGQALAKQALAWFPLEKDAHYWLLAYSRGDERASDQFTKSGRLVEPVLPQFAVSQALLWKNFDDSREAEAWGEAVKRSLAVDQVELSSSVVSMLRQALVSLNGKPDAQRVLLSGFARSPDLLAVGLDQCDAGLADEFLLRIPDASGWLDGLPDDLRARVLERWITLPSAAGAVAYMEEQGGAAVYSRPLANYYAKAGDQERAVRMVAGAERVSLDGGVPNGVFARELAALQGQGNQVAVRRLVQEAVEAKKPDAEKLRVAMATYAAAGDWEMAWKAASRLVTARKNGQ